MKFALLVGYALVFAASAIADDLRPAFCVGAITTLSFLAVGTFYFPGFHSGFRVLLGPAEPTEESLSVHLAGEDVQLRDHAQIVSCAVRPKRIAELIAAGALSAAALLVILSDATSFHPLLTFWGLLRLELAAMVSAGFLVLSFAWASETLLLRRANARLAPVVSVSSDSVVYEFVDDEGLRQAGYTSLPEDYLSPGTLPVVLVLVDGRNPISIAPKDRSIFTA